MLLHVENIKLCGAGGDRLYLQVKGGVALLITVIRESVDCRSIRSDATAALPCVVVGDITMRVLAELVLSALFRLSDLLAPSLSV